MRHHPLTVSGPKPAFKWSKHRRPPKSGEQSARTTTVRVWRGGTLRTLLCPTYSIVARVKHTVCPVLDAAQLDFDLCCADDTLFGVCYFPRAGMPGEAWAQLEKAACPQSRPAL